MSLMDAWSEVLLNQLSELCNFYFLSGILAFLHSISSADIQDAWGDSCPYAYGIVEHQYFLSSQAAPLWSCHCQN